MSGYNAQDYYHRWCKERIIHVPLRQGIVIVHIHRIIRARDINGLPVDFIIRGVSSVNSEHFEFGVVFSENRPEDHQYPLPVLWKRDGNPDPGFWITPRGKLVSEFKFPVTR